jgi:hypothetical protein
MITTTTFFALLHIVTFILLIVIIPPARRYPTKKDYAAFLPGLNTGVSAEERF